MSQILLPLKKIEERLTLINRLKSKYGSSVGEIIEYGKNIEKELSSISISEDEMKKTSGGACKSGG